MATAEIGHENGFVSRARLVRWIGLALLVGVGLILVSRVNDALRRPAYSTPTAQNGIASEHCTQFIIVAKAAYGADWKYRLDPRDTTCAAQVQQQWQSEWNARQPQQLGTMSINAPTAPIAEPSTTTPIDSRIRNPETYCLNVISLARSRYGADWASHVTPEEGANCVDAIRGMAGR